MHVGFGSIKFRSPAEFENHLLWLASDQSTYCRCKYCFKDLETQSVSSSRTVTLSTTTPQQQILHKDNKQEKDIHHQQQKDFSKQVQANSCGSTQLTPLTQLGGKQVKQPKGVTVPRKRIHESTIKPVKHKKPNKKANITCQINSAAKLDKKEFDGTGDYECEDVFMT